MDERLEKSLFHEYIYKRQTLKDLSHKYKRSIQWVHYKIKAYEPEIKVHDPRPVNLICDATFYGKRKDKLGTLVFMDGLTHEILIWKHIQSEKQIPNNYHNTPIFTVSSPRILSTERRICLKERSDFLLTI